MSHPWWNKVDKDRINMMHREYGRSGPMGRKVEIQIVRHTQKWSEGKKKHSGTNLECQATKINIQDA